MAYQPHQQHLLLHLHQPVSSISLHQMNVQQQHGVGTGSIGGNKEQQLQMFLNNYTQITMYKAHSRVETTYVNLAYMKRKKVNFL